MVPGIGKTVRNMDIDDDAFKGIEAIIHSMTKQERANPNILNGSRKKSYMKSLIKKQYNI